MQHTYRLHDQVVHALLTSRHPDLWEVICEVSGESVILRGMVPSPELREEAEQRAGQVAGVAKVVNWIVVREEMLV